MFQDLDATLRALMSDPAAPADLRAADVSFDTPDRGYQPAQATLNLFLHEVVENRELRDEARVMARTETGYTSRLPSLRVDCAYLVTAWSSRTAGFRAQEEHHLLGLALLWLSRFPVIDDRYLQRVLKTPAPPYAVPTKHTGAAVSGPDPRGADPGEPGHGGVLERSRHLTPAGIRRHRDDQCG